MSEIQAFIDKALQAQKQGQIEQAIFILQNALRQDPASVEAHLTLGNVMFELKRWPKAREHYQKALEIDPTKIESYVNLASLHHYEQDFAQAEAILQKALEIDPNYMPALFNLGNLCAEQNRLDQAIDYYLRVLQEKPFAEAAMQIARISQFQGQIENALAFYQQASVLEPRYEQAWIAQAELTLGTVPRTESIRLFHKAFEANPRNPDTCYNLGTLLRQQGQLEAASHYLTIALQLQDALSKV